MGYKSAAALSQRKCAGDLARTQARASARPSESKAVAGVQRHWLGRSGGSSGRGGWLVHTGGAWCGTITAEAARHEAGASKALCRESGGILRSVGGDAHAVVV